LTQRIYHPSRARSAVSDRCPDHGRLRLPECPRTLRLVSVIDGGRILNEKTARSQIIGATAMAIGMTLLEETVFDPGTGRIANVTFADYLVPVHADVPDLDVVFVGEPDRFSPIGAKGLGEVGIVGGARRHRQRRLPRHRPAHPLAAHHVGQTALARPGHCQPLHPGHGRACQAAPAAHRI
jgi:Molybdopterin-binding domain of aldehyde dehydrogenase